MNSKLNIGALKGLYVYSVAILAGGHWHSVAYLYRVTHSLDALSLNPTVVILPKRSASTSESLTYCFCSQNAK